MSQSPRNTQDPSTGTLKDKLLNPLCPCKALGLAAPNKFQPLMLQIVAEVA